MTTSNYLDINRQGWNERTRQHVKSAFYDVPGFVAGNCSLNEIELSELGDVNGKSLLHLQCHFGMDSLSWARRGATVTGIDLADEAIAYARQLSARINLPVEFVCSDVYSVPQQLSGQFDIVFTSYGSIGWLPDLERWAQVVATMLKPGGVFYMADFHPHYFASLGEKYFSHTAPELYAAGTYTDADPGATFSGAEWSHPISEILNSLLGAGLALEFFNEHAYSPYNCFDDMDQREPGKYYARTENEVPMLYSLKVRARS
jgi:2-polyprenyl-3-methyl-5-hydroxy-6-metoxy-1,4-benzoquinol methylase